ncbi:MAG TPA: hypothetical protein VHG08_16135 [Longimicrobium sp.]|nr:hypothetical protein [Longimicrobium sp.]
MANPLTLLMPIKSGIDVVQLGAALLLARKQLNEALTSIGTVHYARIMVLDRSDTNLRPDFHGPYVLAVITDYDGSFDAYIGDFVAQVGDIFNAILKHVVGGEALIPVQNNVAAFGAFIAANDASQHAPNQGLYQAYPQTVQQVLAAFPSDPGSTT